MKTAASLKRGLQSGPRGPASKDSVLRFNEGLIGFAECKNFSLAGSEELAPLQFLQCVEKPEIGFFVLDPMMVINDYYSIVPKRDWEAIGLTNKAEFMALVICVIGGKPSDSTGNFQAPLLVNARKRIGKQVILNDCGMSVRLPLL